MKTILLLALSGTALAAPRTVTLSPVASVGQSLDAFCKQSTDPVTLASCKRNTDESQCHDAKRWNPTGTGVVKEARIVEVHGELSRCIPTVRTSAGWAPFVDGGTAVGRKNDARIDRVDIVEPRGAASYVLFRLATTQQHAETRSFAVCRIDEHGVACGTHAMEMGLDVKMREDGRVELSAHRDPVEPGVPKSDVGAAAKAQIGVYELTPSL